MMLSLLSTKAPPATLASRFQFLGYALAPLGLDAGPWGASTINPSNSHIFTIGRGQPGGRTLWELTLPGTWGTVIKGAPRGTMVKGWGSSAFILETPHEVVEDVYVGSNQELWYIAGLDYAVGGQPAGPACLGMTNLTSGKTYGRWPVTVDGSVDNGYIRSRHTLNKYNGKVALGAGLGSGSSNAPWGYGYQTINSLPSGSTPVTTVVLTTDVLFNSMDNRLTRIGDFVPQNNPNQFPPPVDVNGTLIGLHQGCDTNYVVIQLDDEVLLAAPTYGTGNVGYKIQMPDGSFAPGQAAWGYRNEFQGIWISEANAKGTTLPFERFNPTELGLIAVPTAHSLNSAFWLNSDTLVFTLYGLDEAAGASDPGVVFAGFKVSPWKKA
jgi:hypothetical protein